MSDGLSTADAACERGRALIELGRPEEALAHLRRAIGAAPETFEAHALMALALLELERPEEAVTAAETAVGLEPEAPWLHIVRARALELAGRKRDARDAALEAVRLDPEEPAAYLVLSSSLLATHDEAGALEAARHAVELDPAAANGHDQLGIVLMHHEREQEAADAFMAALALDAEDDVALNNLSVLQLRSGGRLEALAGFERAARAAPQSQVVRQNVLLVGGRVRLFRRVSIGCALLALLLAPGGLEFIPAVVILLLTSLLFEVVRRRALNELGPGTRGLVEDDTRARRFRPHRWNWKRATKFRPWWWLLLERIPPPVALGVNGAGLLLALNSRYAVWIVVLGLALPFSVLRAWRWWRRLRPGAASWRRPG